MLEVAEVQRRLSDVTELHEVIEALGSDGLVSRLVGMVGATRAAVRGAQLMSYPPLQHVVG